MIEKQNLPKIKQKHIFLPDELQLPLIYYFISDTYELAFIREYSGYNSSNYKSFNNNGHNDYDINEIVRIGNWIGWKLIDGGDSFDDINFYTMEYVIEYMEDMYIMFKQSIQDLQ